MFYELALPRALALRCYVTSVLNRPKYSRMDQEKFFKGCLPQISFGPFLNTLSQI